MEWGSEGEGEEGVREGGGGKDGQETVRKDKLCRHSRSKKDEGSVGKGAMEYKVNVKGKGKKTRKTL